MNKTHRQSFCSAVQPSQKKFIGEAIRQLDVDGIAVSSPEHFPFLSNANLPNLTYVRSRQAYAVFLRNGDAFALVCAMDAPMVAAQSWIRDIVPYVEFVQHPVVALAEELRRRGIAEGRLAIDLDFVTQRTVAQLQREMPRLEIVDAYDHLAGRRVLKTPEEIDTIASAARATQHAILAGMAQSHAGDTEREVCTRVLTNALLNGARTILFSSFGSGANALHTHCFATDKVIEPSDIVRLDIGPRFGPWLGDLARTYSAGEPTAQQKQFYRALVSLQRETIEAMRPGRTAASVYRHATETAERLGIRFDYPHIGHSIGLELHESPMLHPGDQTVLQEGMVFNVEPMIVNNDHTLFMHTEDLIAITKGEPRVLTLGLAPDELPLMGTAI